MGFARRLLVLFAALIAVSVPSAAIAAPPSGNAGDTARGSVPRSTNAEESGSTASIGPRTVRYRFLPALVGARSPAQVTMRLPATASISSCGTSSSERLWRDA